MLRVGLTGGIASGKSTVSARLAALGAVVVDADRVAREVVEPGSEGLAEVVARFGQGVLAADGSLDRPALGALVFADEGARRDLEAITHPRVAARSAELFAAAPADAVLVHDIPLLVELGRGADYALVVVVDVPEDERVRRMVELRGMDADQARARMAAQATDEQRREAADVLLDNAGTLTELEAAVDALWAERLVPFERGLREGTDPTPLSGPDVPQCALRSVRSRLRAALGEELVSVDADAGAGAVVVRRLAVLGEKDVRERLRDRGFHVIPERAESPLGDAGATLLRPDPGLPLALRVTQEQA